MSKNEKGLIESTANAVKTLVPETTKQTDGVLSTVVGFFNNVVLYPIKKANRKNTVRKFARAAVVNRRSCFRSVEVYLR